MFTIRTNVFETNSSSTHSIAVPKQAVTTVPSRIDFAIGDYGWSPGTPDPASYLWTAICCLNNKKQIRTCERKIREVCEAHDIVCSFAEPVFHNYMYDGKKYSYLENGEIDHDYELASFLQTIMDDPDMLFRFIVGGQVFTGNDNSDDDSMFTCRTEEFVEEWYKDKEDNQWKSRKIPNPYYMSNWDDFEWFYKGN